MFTFIICVTFACIKYYGCLNNGLALTPPMGWMSWERYRCSVDCDLYGDDCLSETLIMTIADKLVEDGYRDAGYQYIIIDDCWAEKERGSNGELVPDKNRFPHGMKALANYIHKRGLKFGIYSDFGTLTCGRYPGSEFYLKMDADTFASWDVDYVKMDGCYADPGQMNEGYPEFSKWLNNTGRPIIFSCSWPDYQENNGQKANYSYIAKFCNLWRNYADIEDSWASVQSIIKYYAENQDVLIPAAGPGHWNDPDMLILGNFGLSYEQSKTQMAFWALLAAPLIMSNNLKYVEPNIREILLNKDIISINQDTLGVQGRQIYKNGTLGVWKKPLQNKDIVFLIYNSGDNGEPKPYFFCPKQFGLIKKTGYKMLDLFSKKNRYYEKDYRIIFPESNITLFVPPGGVLFYRITIINIRNLFEMFLDIITQKQ